MQQKFFGLFFLTYFIASTAFGKICIEIANQALKENDFGTFLSPKVPKKVSGDEYIFGSTPKTEVRVSEKTINTSTFTLGMTLTKSITVDLACNVQKVSQSDGGPPVIANVLECQKLKLKLITKSPLLLSDTTLSGLCESYFPSVEENRPITRPANTTAK